jgi:hypothetical protein
LNELRRQKYKEDNEFNVANSLIQAGTAWVASGFNPAAAVAAGLTAKRGGTDPLQSGVSGFSKGVTIGNLANAGQNLQAGASPKEYGLDIGAAVTDTAKGAMKSPAQGAAALQSFQPGQELQAMSNMTKAKQTEAKLQADTSKARMQLQLDSQKAATAAKIAAMELDEKQLKLKLEKAGIQLQEYKAWKTQQKEHSISLVNEIENSMPDLIQLVIDQNPSNYMAALEKKKKSMLENEIDTFLDNLQGVTATEKRTFRSRIIKALNKSLGSVE